ncbi:DNA repair protein RadA [Candidatus Falkowbacteria bacterium]|nr:DNA repair protein RadA [Candidatus Falkowbacteria bacterium]
MQNEPKTIFICSKCDAQFPKWSGRCLNCGAWGTITESILRLTSLAQDDNLKFDQNKLVDLTVISSDKFERMKTGIAEIDELFGGGIVKGSLILLGGEPGIGKSTLCLQIIKQLEGADSPLLYVSGEESAPQTKLRVERLNYQPKNLKFLSETNIEEIGAAIASVKPALAIIDSIQTVYSNEVESEAGAVNQIRACTAKLIGVAKKNDIPIIITGHVTKDGTVAGPKTLEHLVDVVVYLEGDEFHDFRILRSTKNRFGSTNEIGVFEMTNAGLIEVKDPTRAFLSQAHEDSAGSAISCFMEGTRAFLIEVQALVTPTIFGYPQRKTSGYDLNRLQMICAVLFKRAGLNLNNQDIHLNIVGGIKVNEPAIDLAVALAIVSALKNKPVPSDTAAIGELGLGGEIRSVSNIEKRISEAEKLGFKNAIIPNIKINKEFKIKLRMVKNLKEAIE